MKSFCLTILFCSLACLAALAPPCCCAQANKKIIGETAWIEVGGLDSPLLARIDTGARICSIHAIDVQVEDPAANLKDNVGREVRFTVENRAGRRQEMRARIAKVSTVKNSQGIEERYVIMLPLSWQGISKVVEVNLRDRSRMSYKLLIGRNWLSHDFVVDVDKKAEERR
jgi:hypothetical protein